MNAAEAAAGFTWMNLIALRDRAFSILAGTNRKPLGTKIKKTVKGSKNRINAAAIR